MLRRDVILCTAPLAAVLAMAGLFLLTKCGLERELAAMAHFPAPGPPMPAKEIDPDTWASAFARQIPPPAELQRDPAEATGALENGLRYVVAEHPESAGRVSLRLLVRAGSLHEEEHERGFAHFIEHMAFRGTRRLPGGPAMDVFERLGLKSGADTNAWTACDRTCYKLDLPQTDEQTLETAFTFLRDVMDGILFRDADVDAERRVVLRELDERKSGTAADLQTAAILPNVRAAQRPPIGLQDTLEEASSAKLREFWLRQYVPSRTVLIVAGDLPGKDAIARIVSHFASLPAINAPPEPPPDDPVNDEGATVHCLPHSAEDARIRITIAAPQPADREPDSPDLRRRELLQRVGMRMLEQRLNRAGRGAQAPAAIFRCGSHCVVPHRAWLEVSGRTSLAESQTALTSVAREWRRARDTGFNDAEFALACRRVRTEMRLQFLNRLIRPSVDVADALVDSECSGRRCESPEVELNRARTDLGAITRAECEEQFRSDWSPPALRVILSGEGTAGLEEAIANALRIAWQSTPDPPPRMDAARALEIKPFGQPGHVVRRDVDPDHDLMEVEFNNRVVAKLRPIPALGGMVAVRVLAGYGALSLPPVRPGLLPATELLTSWNPLDGWRRDEFETALMATEAAVDFDVRDSVFAWQGETDRATLSRQIELLCACVARPGLKPRSAGWKPGRREQAWVEQRIAARSPAQRAFIRHLTGGDWRFDPDGEREGFLETDDSEVAAWLLPVCHRSRLCVIVAGDFSPHETIETLAATFGALPERAAWDEPCPFPPLPVPAAGLARAKPRSGRTAAAFLSFPFAASENSSGELHRTILRDLAGLRIRKVIRESMGASYSPRVVVNRPAGGDVEWLTACVTCAPGRLEETGEALREVFDQLHRDGWTSDEFQRAARPLAWSGKASSRHPDGWLESLAEPHRCLTAPKLDAALTDMEPAIRALSRHALDPAAAVELHVEPDGP